MIRLCINTQTPPFRLEEFTGLRKGQKIPLGHHAQSVGGVVPMMFSLLQSATGKWIRPHPLWVSTGRPGTPSEVSTVEGYRLAFVSVPDDVMKGYLEFKRSMWNAFHSMGSFPLEGRAYSAFLDYSHRCAKKLLEYRDDVDAYYINDYQQILVGSMIGPAAPAMLRWHIPFNLETMSGPLRQFFLKSVEGFDGVVLSTRWEMESLIRAGYRGKAYQIYPYLNEATVPRVSPAAVSDFRDRWRLGDGPVVLVVGRMDPQKRQDIALRAFAHVRRKFPRAVLLMVGNGSFTSSQEEGLRTLSTAGAWRAGLGKLCRTLRIEDAVRFTGYLSDVDIHRAYEASDMLVLSSVQEGFGLVGVEAWMHRRPIVVSSGAGISELVIDGVNGYVAKSGSVSEFARAMVGVLQDRDAAERMGIFGQSSARQCYVDFATRRLRRIFKEVITEYAPEHHRPRSSLRITRAQR